MAEQNIDTLIIDIEVKGDLSKLEKVGQAAEKVAKDAQKASEALDKIEKKSGISKVFDKIKTSMSSGFEKIGEGVSGATEKFGNFFASVKRIALYRLIRSALKLITQGLKEGAQNALAFENTLADVDKLGFNKAVSNITSSLTTLKNAFGVLGLSLLKTIEPIITLIVDRISYLVDKINAYIAIAKGESSYLKVNRKYWEEYGKSVNKATNALAAFDEINLISSGNKNEQNGIDTSKMFEVADVSTAWGDSIKKADEQLNGWKITGGALMALGVLVALASPKLLPYGLAMIGAGATITALTVDWDGVPASLKKALAQISAIVGLSLASIGLILCFVPGMLGTGIALLVAGVGLTATSLIIDAEAVLKPFKDAWAKIKQWFVDNVGSFFSNLWNDITLPIKRFLGLPTSNSSKGTLVGSFAVGGFPEDGLFFANHNELVGGFSNGRTAVANNTQIIEGIRIGVYDAVLEAMSRTNSGNQPVKVEINGREVFTAVRDENNLYKKRTGANAW